LVQQLQWVFRPTQLMDACARRFGDAFTLRFPGMPNMVFVSHPDMVRDVFTGDPATFHAGEANAIIRPIVGESSVLLLDDQRHRAQRRLLMPPFHGDRMERYAAAMREVAAREAASWASGRSFPIHPAFQRISLNVIFRAVFGLGERGHVAELRGALQRMMGLTGRPWILLLMRPDGGLRVPALNALLGDASPTPGRADLVASLHAAVRALDRDALARELRQGFARHGASRYLQDVVVPLLEAVGAEWARGRLDIRHEHLASEAVEDVLRELRRALDRLAAGRPVLLATLPGEDHSLGLHMAALLGALAGRPVRVLGAHTPVAEIAAAARELEAAAVGVPVSAAAAPRATGAALRQLAAALPPGIRLWVGGGGARRLAVPAGVERIADLGRLESAIDRLPA